MVSDEFKLYVVAFLRNLEFFGAIAIPFFLDWAQINYTKIFILEAWFMFWMFALEIPTGIIADKYGRKVSIALGGLLGSIGFLIFGFTQSYFLFFFGEFFVAVGFTLVSGADKALLYDSLVSKHKQKDAKKYFSNYETAGLLGMIFALPLGSLIVGSKFMPYPQILSVVFALAAIPCFLSLFVALSIKEPKRKTPESKFMQQGIEGFKYIFKNKKLKAFVFNSVLISAATFFMFWFYQSLLRQIGMNLMFYGFVAAGFNLFGIFLMYNIKTFEKLFGMKNLLLYSALLPGLFFIGIYFTKNTVFILIAIFMITGLRALRLPIFSDFMNQQIEPKNRATVLSGVSMLEKICTFILYPLMGFLADISLGLAMLAIGIIILFFAFFTRLEAEHLD